MERGKQRETKQSETITSPTIEEHDSLTVGRERLSFFWKVSLVSQSFAPLVLFLLYHYPSILLESGVGAGVDGGAGLYVWVTG